ncbi:MAG: cupredoxin domain-containing protein [Thaumarchaeota archaeon]|nr:cupredoxin domain-containing protein [Nitrososphaerota archaeon]
MARDYRFVIPVAISGAAVAIAVIAVVFSMQNAAMQENQNLSETHSENHYVGQKKEFWLFNSEIPEFNETKMDMPHDVYSMPTITVFKGDHIVIHFFNTEEPGGDHHSFTIFTKPYNINVALRPGENTTITFDANTTGIFPYYCTFHQPTMRGQLVVEPPPY